MFTKLIKKKSVKIFSVFLLIALFFIYNLDFARSYLRSVLPDSTKIYIKKLFFGEKYIKEVQTYRQLNYNQKILPETQFEKIYLSKKKIDGLNDTDQIHYKKVQQVDIKSKKFFIDTKDDLVFIISHDGNLSVIKNLDVKKKK